MTPMGRRTLGVFAIMALITVEAAVVLAYADHVSRWPILVQALFYLAAGLVWLLPLKPLLVWMNGSPNQ